MTSTAEVLRGLPYFSDLDDDLLQDVCKRSEWLQIPKGQTIIEEGSRSEEMYVVVSGQLEVSKRSPTREVILASLGPGEVVGEIALLDGAPRTATVTASVDSEIIRIPVGAFEELVTDARVVKRMFRTVTSRLRGIEDTLRHEERMAALGRMAAQLMHELNNPAAAVGRSSSRLAGALPSLGEAAIALAGAGIDLGDRLQPPARIAEMSAMERADQEEDIATWLDGHDVEGAWDMAPALLAEGWTREALESATADLAPGVATALTRWLGVRALTGEIVHEIQVGSGRISELVRVVKDYSYLDQAPVQEIDPTAGIADTLLLLKHKLRGVEVSTDYEPGLRRIEAPGRDLNQVWTNLIDNAADAMPDGGSLHISARNTDDYVTIEVADTGTGIEPQTLERIFDPFFTTKEPGKGTGLGLHTVHTIVTRAGGEITAASSPAGTTFTIRFPAA